MEGHGDGSLNILFEGFPKKHEDIALRLQHEIADIYPGVVEIVWKKQNIASYGVGPKKMSEHFCYIGFYKNQINLGFYKGATLPDPKNLLEGSGKKLRHIKIFDITEINNDIIDLINAAYEDIKH